MKPKVSVLVTFYNQEQYVDRALNSILNQRVSFDFEVLVGDDGSTDNTQKIVKEWIDKYPSIIKLYVMKRGNEKSIPGFRASRNRIALLNHVRGEYFIFLDGDDYYENDKKLQLQVNVLDSNSNRDCVACSHNIDSLYADGSRKKNTPDYFSEGKYEAKKYWRDLYFHTNTLLVRSSVIEKLPFELLENNFNDNLITYSIIQFGKIYYLPESMAVYVQTGNGIWTSHKVVVNLLRNILMYDLCIKINPGLKKETIHRLGGNFFRIYQARKQINSKELNEFIQEAANKQLYYSFEWANFSNAAFVSRLFLCLKSIGIAILSKVL